MAVITPSTDVILLKVPLEIDENNQLTFSNASAQYDYFTSLPSLYFDTNFTYQRKDGVLKVPAFYDDVMSYNYVMYRNTAYDDKWFYAFIENAEYVNDSVTALSLKTDTWQTWMFDLNYKPVFVEREHVNDDTIGANLIPEQLETGEYVQNGQTIPLGIGTLYRFVLNSNYAPYSDNSTYLGTNLYGVPIAGGIFVFDYWQQMINAIQSYSSKGKLDSIENCWLVPANSFNDSDLDLRTGGGTDETSYYFFTGNTTPITRTKSFSMPTTIDGYTPKNNKLLTSPYINLVLSNNNGSANSYGYEYFTNPNDITFTILEMPSIGASNFIYPNDYKNISSNYNEGLMSGKYPTLSWSGDAFTNWLTQNAVNIGTGIVSDIAKLPLIPANPLVGTLSLGTSIAGTVSEIYQHSLVSQAISGNTNGGDVLTGKKINECYLYHMSIKAQFARVIDDYLSQFGYRVNTVKLPNITGRRNWNYVKTIGCYIEADIPESDLSEIKSFFDRGITFWHNPATFADYSQNNDII